MLRRFIIAFVVTTVGLLAYWAYLDQTRPIPVKKSDVSNARAA